MHLNSITTDCLSLVLPYNLMCNNVELKNFLLQNLKVKVLKYFEDIGNSIFIAKFARYNCKSCTIIRQRNGPWSCTYFIILCVLNNSFKSLYGR